MVGAPPNTARYPSTHWPSVLLCRRAAELLTQIDDPAADPELDRVPINAAATPVPATPSAARAAILSSVSRAAVAPTTNPALASAKSARDKEVKGAVPQTPGASGAPGNPLFTPDSVAATPIARTGGRPAPLPGSSSTGAAHGSVAKPLLFATPATGAAAAAVTFQTPRQPTGPQAVPLTGGRPAPVASAADVSILQPVASAFQTETLRTPLLTLALVLFSC